MPARHTLHLAKGLVATPFPDPVSDEELGSLHARLSADPLWHPGANERADLRLAPLFGVSARAPRDVDLRTRSLHGARDPGVRTAVVAPSDPAFGMGRMYEAFSDAGPGQTRVVRDVEPAFDWLGLRLMEPEDLHRPASRPPPP